MQEFVSMSCSCQGPSICSEAVQHKNFVKLDLLFDFTALMNLVKRLFSNIITDRMIAEVISDETQVIYLYLTSAAGILQRCKEGKREPCSLTALVRADRDDGHLPREGAHVRDAVEGFDLEGVVGVCREVHDGNGAVGQAQRSRQEAEVFLAQLAAAGLWAASLAQDVVGQVASAAGVAWRRPLQHQAGVIQVEHQVAGR